MKAEISAKLKLCKYQLDALGRSRATRDQQYKFLLELATQFQTIASLALKAHYGGDGIFDTVPSLKLATAVVSRNTTFSDDVQQRGHAIAFHKNRDTKKKSPASFGSPTPLISHAPIPFGSITPMSTKPMAKDPTHTPPEPDFDPKHARYEKGHSELEEIMQDDSEVPLPQVKGIKQWLENVYKSSRGFELGTFDASLMPVIWRKQSANWEPLALGYVDDIISLVHSFTVDLLASICKDP